MNMLNVLDKSYVYDQRLVSAGHSGQIMTFCEPTLSGKMCMDDVSTGYYGDYSDIRAGNVQYYTDRSVMRPFVDGVFAPTVAVKYHDYVDSNGIVKPHYTRLLGFERPTCLTFISDTQRSRDDLIAANLWRRNQQNGFVGI